jgi:hypothetical protein
MIGIGEIQIASAIRFLQQDVNYLLPDAAPLVFEQAAVAGFRRGGNVMGQVFPLAASFEHVQDAIENFPLVGPRPSGPRAFRQQGAQIVPLDIRHIGSVRLPGDRKNMM